MMSIPQAMQGEQLRWPAEWEQQEAVWLERSLDLSFTGPHGGTGRDLTDRHPSLHLRFPNHVMEDLGGF